MGKPRSEKKQNKMSELVTERRKPGEQLKRSKSVRASLRLIGHKFLHTSKNHADPMQKTPSLSSLTEYKREFKRSRSHEEGSSLLTILPEYYVRESVETILKTPMIVEPKSKPKFKDKIRISTPPSVIAPKAAQILQIPVKEFYEPLSLNSEGVFFRKANGYVPDRPKTGQISEFSSGEYRTRFHRTTLRLSLVPSRKKSHWNAAGVELPSTYF